MVKKFLVNLPEITQDEAMQFIPMDNNTMVNITMVSDRAKVNTYLPMEISMKEIINIIKSTASASLPINKRENIMVALFLFRAMVKWIEAWRRDICVSK